MLWKGDSMKKTGLVVLASWLLFGQPSAAQVSIGNTGVTYPDQSTQTTAPLRLIDSTGTVVGPVLDWGEDRVAVLIDVAGTKYFAYAKTQLLTGGSFIAFTTDDCTGTPYLLDYGPYWLIPTGVYQSQFYRPIPGSNSAAITTESEWRPGLDPMNPCFVDSNPNMAWEVQLVPEIDFEAPFSLEGGILYE